MLGTSFLALFSTLLTRFSHFRYILCTFSGAKIAITLFTPLTLFFIFFSHFSHIFLFVGSGAKIAICDYLALSRPSKKVLSHTQTHRHPNTYDTRKHTRQTHTLQTHAPHTTHAHTHTRHARTRTHFLHAHRHIHMKRHPFDSIIS